MNGICRLGDTIVPHCVAAPTITASSFVRVDGIAACRDRDVVDTHITPPCEVPGPPHTPQIDPPANRFARFDGLRAGAGNDNVDQSCTNIDPSVVSTFMRTS